MQVLNLFQNLPIVKEQEHFSSIIENKNFKLERIISKGHVTEQNKWYNQELDEWVLLLQGAAKLRFKDESKLLDLKAGDYLLIPAHHQHRVEWTEPDVETIWLALHFNKT